jgi:hypothetical protein
VPYVAQRRSSVTNRLASAQAGRTPTQWDGHYTIDGPRG